jgi:hypothetical protein
LPFIILQPQRAAGLQDLNRTGKKKEKKSNAPGASKLAESKPVGPARQLAPTHGLVAGEAAAARHRPIATGGRMLFEPRSTPRETL